MILPAPSGVIIAAALLHTLPQQGESNATIDCVKLVDESVQTNPVETVNLPDDANSGQIFEIQRQESPSWTRKEESKFLRLAEKEALGVLSSDEIAELEKLSGTRYALKTPRSGEQILLEYQQSKLTSELVKALEKYVAFQKSAGHSSSKN